MEKIYEVSGEQSKDPFDLNLIKDNGELEDFYIVNEGMREKTTLAELINDQVKIIKNNENADNFSKNYAKVESNGDEIQIGSSGDFVHIGSSGKEVKIANSGDYAHIVSNGFCAQIGSSGGYTQIGCNEEFAHIVSGGYKVKIGSSGDLARIGTSGFGAWIGSSGERAHIGSSGEYAHIGSSGRRTQIESSGDYALIGSSGDYAQINVTGSKGVAFACGSSSVVKAQNGTWISLCEWKRNEYGEFVPYFVSSAQIGNEEYTDCNGTTLTETTQYILHDKQFTPVIIVDDFAIKVIRRKNMGDLQIIKAEMIDEDKIKMFCVIRNGLSACGRTLHEAMRGLKRKELCKKDWEELNEL